MSQQVKVVKRLFEAVRRRDQPALLEAYHPEVTIHEAPSLPYGGDFRGHAGAIEHVQAFYRTWSGLKRQELLKKARRARPLIFLETAEDYVVVFGRHLAVDPQTGRWLDVPEAFVFRMRDNRVIESWMLNQDTVAVLEFLRSAKSQDPAHLCKVGLFADIHCGGEVSPNALRNARNVSGRPPG